MELIFDVEHENEFLEIYTLVKTAFENSENADGDEQDYVNNLRKSENYIPALAMTIKDGKKIIAHIMLTKTSVVREKETLEALLLSPICTHFEYRKKGIASQLIKHGLSEAKNQGFKAVFLVGEPEFYSKFGFKSITYYGIEDKGEIPEQFTMGLELQDGFLGTKGGTISIC